MPLSSAQERAAIIILSSGAGQLCLAGGGALIALGLVERGTQDLDAFTSAAGSEFDDLAARVRNTFASADYTITGDSPSAGEIRTWYVRERDRSERGRAPETVKIQICRDTIVLPTTSTRLGPVLDAEELGANKILAIYDRARPRDIDDVARLMSRLSLDRLLEVADSKQVEPLDRQMLADSLRMFTRALDADFPDPSMAGEVKLFAAELARRLGSGDDLFVPSPYQAP